jgi:hypothetical protein
MSSERKHVNALTKPERRSGAWGCLIVCDPYCCVALCCMSWSSLWRLTATSSTWERTLVCSRMLTYAHVCSRMEQLVVAYSHIKHTGENTGVLTDAHVCSPMITYAAVCSRMLAYAHVCSRMLTHAHVWSFDSSHNVLGYPCPQRCA